MGSDPKIMILHEVISEILEISDFEAAILKMAEISSESQLCFLVISLIWLIPEGPLIKMVPLSEDHGGCMGTPVSSRTKD